MKFLYFFLLITLLACQEEAPTAPELMDAINSASVAFVYSDSLANNFFQNPSEAYVSGYFLFEEDLAEDIIFDLDIEWLEGVDTPLHFEGADWMALVGLNREGILWFSIGSPENLQGTPTGTDKWETRNLNTKLVPNVWYKMTIEADFGAREFLAVKIEGNGLSKEVDISGFPLEYPNYIPFDKPSLTYYTFALRSKEFAPENSPGTQVYFDDTEVGLIRDTAYVPLFTNGFEDQSQPEDIPFILPVSPLRDVRENFWYYENGDAKIKIINRQKRNGRYALECNADLSR